MEKESEATTPTSVGDDPSSTVAVNIEMPGVPPTNTATYWAGFSAGASFVTGQMEQALHAAWALSSNLVQRVSGRAPASGEEAQGAPSEDVPSTDDRTVDLEEGDVIVALEEDGDPTSAGGESSNRADAHSVQDDAWASVAMHAVLGVPLGETSSTRALRRFCREHFGGASPGQCQDRLFDLALRWRMAPSDDEREAGRRLVVWIRAYGERRLAFQAAWQRADLMCFQARVEAQWQNIGETSLVTPQAVVSNLLQAGYSESDLFELLGMVIGGLDRRAQDGDEGCVGIGGEQWSAMLDQLVQQRLRSAQQTTVGFIPDAVQHKVDQLSSLAREVPRQPRSRPLRFAIGVPLTVLVQKPVCIFLGRCIARQTVESLFDVMREAGYSTREIAAIFGVLSTGTLAAGYVYLLLHRSRHPPPQQFRHWRFSTVVMQAGQISAILLSALGPVMAGALVSDVHAKTLRWGGVAAFTATQAYMTIVSKFVRQTFQTGSSGPAFPLLQLDGVPKSMKVRQQVFRDVAGILSASLVTALSIWCPVPADGRTLVARVITEDFYLMLTDWFSDDPTELASVLLMRWFPGELDPATLSISPKDVPNPFGFSAAQVRDGLLEVLDNGCSRVFNGLGDTLSFAAKSLELADQPGAALFLKWLTVLIKAPLSTRRSTLLTVLRTGVGDPRGIQSRALSLLASMVAGHPVEVDGVPVPEWRDLAPNEMAELSLLRFHPGSGRVDPAPLDRDFRVRQLTLPEGRGCYRVFEWMGRERRISPYFHQVAEVKGDGHTACLAAFNMVTMELLGRQSPDLEQAHGWLLDTVLDEGGHALPVQTLCWTQVLAHFHRVHPRAARLRLQRLHWNLLGTMELDGESGSVRRALRPLRAFGLAVRRAPDDPPVHVLVLPMGCRYGFFSPHSPMPLALTPRRQRMDPLDAIIWWRDRLAVGSETPETGGGLIELESNPLEVELQSIEILSLARDEERH
jgi:hypothetical protein